MIKKHFEAPLIKRLHIGMPGKFGLPSTQQPLSEIDGVTISSLVSTYGSPLFILSEKSIRETYRKAHDAFSSRYPRVQFGWSYKTNYLDAVCRIFHSEGAWAEVVSGFEYQKALRNGVPGNQIIFNGPDKSEEDLRLAIDNKSLIHIDHFDEIDTLIGLAAQAGQIPRVAIRVNMDTGIYPKWDRFGFNYENGEAMQAVRMILGSGKLELTGLHTHIGTYVISVQAYRTAATKMASLALEIEKESGRKISYIDMGGGFASRNTLKGAYHSATDTTPSFDEYAEAITSVLSLAFEPGKTPVLILETGRALVDEAGYLAGKVIATKRLADGRKALVFDFGVNILFTSFWYDHEISPVNPVTDSREDAVFYGPLCMNIDQIRDHVPFPLLEKDDMVVVSRVGAYNMTQWMQFITLRPNVVMIGTDGEAYLVRKAESLETIVSSEIVPAFLNT